MIKYLISLSLLVLMGILGCFGQGRISRPNKTHNSTVTQNKPEEVVVDQLEFVDLGLPSKTLWANKNVGANKITDSGSNETWTSANQLIDKSDAISIYGRIPSEVEFRELKKLCQWEWTSKGGTNGYKIVGPNGNSIFLPVTSNYGSGKYRISTGAYTEFVDNSAYWTSSEHDTLPNCVWLFTLSKYETVIQYANILSESKKERKFSLRLVN